MILSFRVISDEKDDFSRIIEISDESSFLDFHEIIQTSVGYDSRDLASFFISNKDWERGEQVTLLDMADGDADDIVLMENAKLKEYYPEGIKNLVYVFDFFSNRAFYISLIGSKENENDSDMTPCCIKKIGKAPVQILLSIDDSFDIDVLGKDSKGENYDDPLSDLYEDELNGISIDSSVSIDDLDSLYDPNSGF